MDYKELLLTDEEIQAIICGYQVESSAIWNSDLSRNEKIIKVASLESVYRRVAEAKLDKALNIRLDCERCNGKGSWVKEDDACNAVGDPCDNCGGQGKAGLSLGEVWERYQQGKLVEKENK